MQGRVAVLVAVLVVSGGLGAALPGGEAQAQSPTTSAAVPTFSKDVLPILQRSCQNCHRPGQMAPFSLMTYESARPWARAMKASTTSRYMPPWHIDRSIGEYHDDPSLSDSEVATIAKWADGGAPLGNPADAPRSRVFPSDHVWIYGEEPDLVVEAPAVDVPATGADTYPELFSPTGLKEERYIKWMQVVPEHPKVLHHTVAYILQKDAATGAVLGPPGNTSVRPAANGQLESLLIMFAGGGASGVAFPDGQAKLLQADSTIRFSNHLHPSGQSVTERTKLAFKFFPKGYRPTHLISTKPIGSSDALAIPPNEPNARSDAYFTLAQAARIVSFLPHMHFRGKRMRLEAIPPDGKAVVLTDVARFRWNWQLSYRYKNPPAFPKGTVLHVTSWHDNSSGNRDNPDPSAFVGWGDRTVDEMNNGWVDYYYITDQEYSTYLTQNRPRTATGAAE